MKKWFPLDVKEVLAILGPSGFMLALLQRLGVRDGIAVSVSLGSFVLVLLLWAIGRVWQYDGNRFCLVFAKQGEDALSEIAAARESILVTHFGTVIPSPTYVSRMLEKLAERVQVTRIVGPEPARNEKTKEWLARFKGLNCYSQFDYSHAVFPFDFTIFDGTTVILYLPSQPEGRQFTRALIFKNSEVAIIFRGIFERLRHESTPSVN